MLLSGEGGGALFAAAQRVGLGVPSEELAASMLDLVGWPTLLPLKLFKAKHPYWQFTDGPSFVFVFSLKL